MTPYILWKSYSHKTFIIVRDLPKRQFCGFSFTHCSDLSSNFNAYIKESSQNGWNKGLSCGKIILYRLKFFMLNSFSP